MYSHHVSDCPDVADLTALGVEDGDSDDGQFVDLPPADEQDRWKL